MAPLVLGVLFFLTDCGTGVRRRCSLVTCGGGRKPRPLGLDPVFFPLSCHPWSDLLTISEYLSRILWAISTSLGLTPVPTSSSNSSDEASVSHVCNNTIILIHLWLSLEITTFPTSTLKRMECTDLF